MGLSALPRRVAAGAALPGPDLGRGQAQSSFRACTRCPSRSIQRNDDNGEGQSGPQGVSVPKWCNESGPGTEPPEVAGYLAVEAGAVGCAPRRAVVYRRALSTPI